MVSFLDRNNKVARDEYEDFVSTHEYGTFMQSLMWPEIKSGWDYEVIIVREESEKIVGTMLVLTRKIPVIGTSMMYAPRGPVCNPDDKKTLAEITEGVEILAKKRKAHIFTCDPDVREENSQFIHEMASLGYKQFKGGFDFDATIQPRFNYRIPLRDENGNQRSEEEIFENFHKKTRYNTRLAGRRGVTVEVCGKEYLPEFVRLMEVTGERDGFNTRPASYFENILDTMGEHARLYLAFYEGEPISGAITTQYADKTCYVYGASDNEHRNVMPTYLMQWEMIKWAIENDNVSYDFQGVSGDLDENSPLYGLYRFKSGFTGEMVELVGEMSIVFKPFANKMFNILLSVRDFFIDLKGRFKK